jgi:hypothetical protein
VNAGSSEKVVIQNGRSVRWSLLALSLFIKWWLSFYFELWDIIGSSGEVMLPDHPGTLPVVTG